MAKVKGQGPWRGPGQNGETLSEDAFISGSHHPSALRPCQQNGAGGGREESGSGELLPL